MYNVEPYVERCLRSLEDQDIPKNDYEIICINDGSPDDCRGVVLRLQGEFNNIVLIDQENQGVSRARNKGIDNSNGEYLLFIDPDDYVDSQSFGRILKKVYKQNAQISFLGFTFLNENRTIRKQVLNENHSSQIYPGIEAYFLARGDGSIDPDRMWAILIDIDLLKSNNLRFLPNVPFLEDGEFIARILCLADRCIFDVSSFYKRTTRPGSATNSLLFYSEKATSGFLKAARNLKSFQQEQNLNEEQRAFLNQPIAKFVLLAINSCLSWGKGKKLVETISTLYEAGFRRIDLDSCRPGYKLVGKTYNLSPFLGAIALILMPRINRLNKLFRIKEIH